MESHNDDVSEVNIPPTALNSLVIRGHEGNGKRCTILMPRLLIRAS